MVRYRVPGWIATLVTTLLLITIFSLYGSSHFYRDPGSIFFRFDRAFEKSYSLQRELEAVAFLQAEKSEGDGDQQSTPDTDVVPNLCTVVMASPRGPEASFHTAELTIASALAGLMQAERQDLDLRVYLTSTNATKLSPLHQSVGHLVNSMFTRQNVTSTEEQEFLRELERKGQTGHKAALDYVYALQSCFNQSESPYIAVLEDDILMADGWLARTRLALQEIEGRAGGRWLDLRLFNQVRSLGWGSTQIIRRNAILLITIICSIIVGGAFVSKRRSHQNSLAVPTVLVLCLVTVPASVTLFFQAGKASVLPPPHGVSEQAWGPCTQGNVFAQSQVPGLIEAVRKDAPHKAHDLIILDHAALNDMIRYVLTPPQIQHIGFHSVVSPSRPQDEFPWSIAFEDLKAATLAHEHTEMVRKLYHVQ